MSAAKGLEERRVAFGNVCGALRLRSGAVRL
jgi:hypothetical protein